MTYRLIIGDRTYSSWSLRGWLLFDCFDLPVTLDHVSFDDDQGGWAAIDALPPAKTVPTLVTPEGAIVSDSLAMAEELATRHPDAGLWPTDPKARATARTLSAEMHSSFGALRNDCPMHLRVAYSDFAPSDAVRQDLARIDQIWDHAFNSFGGPWLCGDYSIADVFFAPVAARIATYGLPTEHPEYVAAHLAHPAFRRWRAMALVKGPELPWYARDNTQTAWPGPKPLAATPSNGPSINATCPYSGDPVTDFLSLDGVTYGFCNPFCRDKTLADPQAWPAFVALMR